MNLYQEEANLELEAIDESASMIDRVTSKKKLSNTPMGRRLIAECFQGVVQELEKAKKPKGVGVNIHYLERYLNDDNLHLSINQLATVIVRSVVNGVMERKSLQNLGLILVRTIETENMFEKFRKEYPFQYRRLRLDRGVSNVANTLMALKNVSKTLDLNCARKIEATEAAAIGIAMIEIVLVVTTWFTVEATTKRSVYKLCPTDKFVYWIQNSISFAKKLLPIKLPMVVPPLGWTTDMDGGYLERKHRLIQTKYKQQETKISPDIMKAANHVQSIPWRIDKQVLEVMTTLSEDNNGEADLPKIKEMPAYICSSKEEWKSFKVENPDLAKEFRKSRATTREDNTRQASRLIQLRMLLAVADKYKAYEKVFFPVFFDWRGRLYFSTIWLNPQGDDRAKAILKYAVGKPIDGNGLRWLKIHGANKFGLDKKPYKEREQWVDDNEELIMKTAEAPYSSKEWMGADDPWCFLAFCFEWRRYRQYGDQFLSKLPISVDGTCSGLQHFSALLKDNFGAKSSNLIDCDVPNDIYQIVADKVQKLIKKDMKNKDVLVSAYAQAWNGKVDRKLAKRPTMTQPYGVTLNGVTQQLFEFWKDKEIEFSSGVNPWRACSYLAKTFFVAIEEVAPASEIGKQFFRSVSKVCVKYGVNPTWISESNYKIIQHYPKRKYVAVKTTFGTVRINLKILEEDEGINGRKNVNSLSPNVIHSLDASHLIAVVNAFSEDKTVSVVHDSFSTHCTDVDELQATLRQEFVNQYGKDILKRYLSYIKKTLPKKAWEELPEIPVLGDFDVEEIKKSKYAFS